MTREADFIAQIRAGLPVPADGLGRHDLAAHGASLNATALQALGLTDDVALLPPAGMCVISKDMLAQGVHYRTTDTPEDMAWKLLAVNLSDIAAKGAAPYAALLGYSLRETAWDTRFATAFQEALRHYGLALLGGDTISLPRTANGDAAPQILSLTIIGRAGSRIPLRSGACLGDAVYVTGVIGDAAYPQPANPQAYARPEPQLAAGQCLAPHVHAMMDISDGLLIDAQRMAHASGLCFTLNLDAVPLSPAYKAAHGEGLEARVQAASAGDDYQLLFTAAQDAAPPHVYVPLTRIGAAVAGQGLKLYHKGAAVALPPRLGWEHKA